AHRRSQRGSRQHAEDSAATGARSRLTRSFAPTASRPAGGDIRPCPTAFAYPLQRLGRHAAMSVGSARSVRVAAGASEGTGDAAMALADRAAGDRAGAAAVPVGLRSEEH